MKNDLRISSNPMHRNALDVATELTLMYISEATVDSPNDVQDVFLRCYSVAQIAPLLGLKDLVAFLPEQLKTMYEKRITETD